MSTSATAAAMPRERARVHAKPPRHRVRHIILGLLVKLVVLVLLVVVIYPLFWLVTGSFKTQNEFVNQPIWSLPSHLDWGNYTAAWTTGHMGIYLRNSITAVVPSLALIIILGVAAGFALEVMIFRGRASILLYFLLGIMIPGQMILLPLFTVYFRLGAHGLAVAPYHHLYRDRPAADRIHDGDFLRVRAARGIRGIDPRWRQHAEVLPVRSRPDNAQCHLHRGPGAVLLLLE